MMYGSGLPILFPIACVSFLLIYLTDMLMVYKIFRKPTRFDEELHKTMVKKMTYAAILHFLFSFWQLSNKQLLPYPGMPLEHQKR